MSIPSAADQLAKIWEQNAQVLRQQRYVDDALRIEDMVKQMRTAIAVDDETLLTPDEAQAYSRGYEPDYLRRQLENHGSRFFPLYRKGDLPRHPVVSEKAKTEIKEKKGKRGVAKAV